MNDDAPIPVLKAAGVNSLLNLLLERAPAERLSGWQRVLPPATMALISRRKLASEWVPLEVVAPLYETALRVLFNDDAEVMYELGRQQLRNDLSGIYRVFLRVASPHYVADKTAQIYGVYTQHCGTLEVTARTERSLDFVLLDRPFPSLAFFESLRGSIAGALELTGIKDVKVTTVSEPGPAARVFHASWR